MMTITVARLRELLRPGVEWLKPVVRHGKLEELEYETGFDSGGHDLKVNSAVAAMCRLGTYETHLSDNDKVCVEVVRMPTPCSVCGGKWACFVVFWILHGGEPNKMQYIFPQ
jgi:hypothetical protein